MTGRGQHRPRDRARVCALYVAWGTCRRVGATRQAQGAGGIAQIAPGERGRLRHWVEAVAPVFPRAARRSPGAAGQPEDGLRLLAEAHDGHGQHGRALLRGRLDRLAGRVAAGPRIAAQEDAEASLRHALAIARRQQAKSLEAAGGREPQLACGSSRASEPKPASCWHRSTAGSPRALTPPTCRTPKRCWRSWEANTSLHHPPLPPWAHQCRSGAPQRVAANPDTKQACLQSVASWVLRGGMDCGTQYPWHNRPYGLDGLPTAGRQAGRARVPARCPSPVRALPPKNLSHKVAAC